MNKRKVVNTEYSTIALVVLLLGVAIMMVVFSEAVIAILTCDVALMIGASALDQRIRSVMRKKASKELKKSELPINWIRTCAYFSLSSILASLGYVILAGFNVNVTFPMFSNWAILSYCFAFFLFALIYFARIIMFIVEPSSKGNILVGKIIRGFLTNGLKVTLVAFLVAFQIPNVLMLYAITQTSPKILSYLYGFTIILSFIGAVIIAYNVIFHFTKQFVRRDWFSLVSFVSPWILLYILAFLLYIGVKL